MKKKILIISNYYPPEMGAAANRIQQMAEGLKDKGNEVTVICPMPNYPYGKIQKLYQNKFTITENYHGVTIKRYWIYPSISKNIFLRFFSMLSFAMSLWFSVFTLFQKKPDICIVQSPPLLVAFSGLILSKLIGCKTILNVSDLWPLSAFELGAIKKNLLYRFLEKVEQLNYKIADKIMGQSNEIITHIKSKVKKDFLLYRNLPFYDEYRLKTRSKGRLKIVYAGLLGYAQGVYNICNQINFKALDVEFHIYGSGMEEAKILNFCKDKDVNVFFHGSKTVLEIKEEVRKYDVAIVPLATTIYGAVPSKIFELMQLGMPILYVGDGEASKIIKNKKIGMSSLPNDDVTLIQNITKFKKMSTETYNALVLNALLCHKDKYSLDIQINHLNQFIINS